MRFKGCVNNNDSGETVTVASSKFTIAQTENQCLTEHVHLDAAHGCSELTFMSFAPKYSTS